VIATAVTDAEMQVQKTTNDRTFDSKFYRPEDCKDEIFGDGVWDNTARRQCRTVFDYENAPYSNMVLGELINMPGRWTSYVPHGHDQPEVYYYRFLRPEGFGAAFIGDDVWKIQDNSALCIPGGPTHPQCAAPGFPMWYSWMIRHLDGNPWNSRDVDPRYKWLLEPGVKIWPNDK
jgi:5-deoxy-glucuronate isomerase